MKKFTSEQKSERSVELGRYLDVCLSFLAISKILVSVEDLLSKRGIKVETISPSTPIDHGRLKESVRQDRRNAKPYFELGIAIEGASALTKLLLPPGDHILSPLVNGTAVAGVFTVLGGALRLTSPKSRAFKAVFRQMQKAIDARVNEMLATGNLPSLKNVQAWNDLDQTKAFECWNDLKQFELATSEKISADGSLHSYYLASQDIWNKTAHELSSGERNTQTL